MARELAEENKYFVHYGVEFDKTSIQPTNNNTILLTTIYAGIKLMFRELFKGSRSDLNKNTYKSYKKIASDTFDQVFEALPEDIDVSGKYLIEKSYTLKGICSFINHVRYIIGVEDETVIWEAIKKVDWTQNPEYWKNYRAVITKRGQLSFGGSGDHGRIAVVDALLDNLPNDILVRAEKKSTLKVKEDEAPEGQTILAFE
jgi:hypothetical protein